VGREFARERGDEVVLAEGDADGGCRERRGGAGAIGRGGGRPGRGPDREGGEGNEEAEGEQGSHGQRFMLATFWSISSEVWMDFELIS
jgi:hypothetical protein